MTAYHPTDRKHSLTAAVSFLQQFHTSPHTSRSPTRRRNVSRPQSPSKVFEAFVSRCPATSDIATKPEPEKEKKGRSDSYSSVKEDRTNAAQSFLVSPKRRSDCLLTNEANGDTSSTASPTCTCRCKCGSGGRKTRSRSYSPLPRSSSPSSFSDLSESAVSDYLSRASTPEPVRPGEALLEELPIELLEKVIGQLAEDLPPAEYSPRNKDLISCLLTSRTIHAVTSRVLYRHITIPHSKIFSKFLNHLVEIPDLGKLVRRLDLSHFSSVGLGRTQQLNTEIQNMTSKTLLKCLELTPGVQEVLLQVHLAQDIDAEVVQKLFYGLSNLRSLDFCAAAAGTFVEAFSAAVTKLYVSPSTMLDIQNLSLHECFTLHSSDLEILLSRLPRLRILDLHHTRVTDDALFSIPDTARLTHLNLGRCNGVSGNGVVDFITTHPAAKSLVYLDLSCDVSRYRLLWTSHVDELLPVLPSTLRSLNLNGAHIGKAQLPLLLPLTKHLEELGLGYTDLSITDILSIFRPSQLDGVDEINAPDAESWVHPAIHYLDLTEVTGVTQPFLFGQASTLLGSLSSPLEVIEVSEKVISGLRKAPAANKKFGWVVRELGRRGWYVRERRCDDAAGNDREWKMGAKWWGMRKTPVAWGDVGGLYGHYMFKK